ncbi:lysozyme [Azospirillum argentinense]|uniref:Lysozyme n=1 Tax=Azospirillum argentinense TaxID=2970906 RepID=A0A4D8PE62_9PROT|nr:lysozyme [Azospirillum argentinense]QCN95674.1 lysozyme [Azospirillum argentinense]
MTTPVCEEAVNLVKHFEGLYLNAYLCPAGVPTIGYGHTAGVELGQSITSAQADNFLQSDLTAAAAQVDKLVTVALNPDQRGALASFVFNLGAGSLQCSTLLRLLNQGDYEGAAGQFGRWVYATVNGVKTQLPGLVKRRAAEADLFESSTTPLPQASVSTATGA